MGAQRAIILAWLAGLGLLTVRELQVAPRPPAAGRYLAASGLYAGLAVLAEWPAAAPAAAAVAWGFNLAIVLQVLPEQVGGRKTKTAAAGTAATATGTGTETA